MIYRTRDGDVLDQICDIYYGAGAYSLDRIFAANPGLAKHGAVYSSGVYIELPDAEQVEEVQQTVRLWD